MPLYSVLLRTRETPSPPLEQDVFKQFLVICPIFLFRLFRVDKEQKHKWHKHSDNFKISPGNVDFGARVYSGGFHDSLSPYEEDA